MKSLTIILSLVIVCAAIAQEPAALLELRQGWEKARSEAQAKVDELYLAELEELKKNYLKAGNLEGAVATQNEIDQNGKNTKDPAGLSKLRKSYKKSVEVSRKKLFESYYEDLEKLKQQYMSEANLSSSISVDKEMKRVVDTYKKSQPPKPSRVKKYNKTDSFKGFKMEFVVVDNPNNNADDTGYGAVPYIYRIGKYEVSRAMIEAYNGDPKNKVRIGIADLTNRGGNGAKRPATGMNWFEAARFVNWLNVSKGYPPAYRFTDTKAIKIELWNKSEVWQLGGQNSFRNKGAKYFLPTIDESYKAAYYDPRVNNGKGGYWNYATGSDKIPESVAAGNRTGEAVWNGQLGPADITSAGGLSPYGTMAQNGNACEWSESAVDGNTSDVNKKRFTCGSAWYMLTINYNSGAELSYPPEKNGWALGFRVASVAD